MKFRLKGGRHVEDDITYNKGDVITTGTDLAAKFGKRRFERLGKFVDEDVEQPRIRSTQSKTRKKKSKKKEKDSCGLDVTEDFAVAKDAGLTVFEKEHWLTVFDENDVVLNDKKLRKKDVPSFLEEYLSKEELEEEEELIQFDKGDRVVVNIGGEEYAGSISQIKGDNAIVKFDDGDVDTYALDELVLEGEEEED